MICAFHLRAIPEIILGGCRHILVLWGEGVLLTTVSKGWGVTCPGDHGVFDP